LGESTKGTSFENTNKDGTEMQFEFKGKRDYSNEDEDKQLRVTLSEVDSEGNPLEEWKKNKKFSRKYYAWIALASGIFFGNQVFLMQVVVYSQMSKLNFVLFFPVFIGYLFTSLIYQTK
jgi:hypothetical protein